MLASLRARRASRKLLGLADDEEVGTPPAALFAAQQTTTRPDREMVCRFRTDRTAPTVHGLGGLVVPFVGIKLIEMAASGLSHARPATSMILLMTLLLGIAYPLAILALGQGFLVNGAEGEMPLTRRALDRRSAARPRLVKPPRT
jgi:hypothetical protein